VNRVLDAPPKVREEGDVLVIPILEEVVEKRWLLKEEVRVRRRSVQTTHRDSVVLRTEMVSVEREPRPSGPRTKSNRKGE
jgi:stress response protein YsnF